MQPAIMEVRGVISKHVATHKPLSILRSTDYIQNY
jgi:hypothetical protein